MRRADLVATAESFLGAPYIWRGKGLYLWDPVKGLVAHDFNMPVFDCSGLPTVVIWALGGPDWRHTHSSQTLFDEPALKAVETAKAGDLALYGFSPESIHHVMMVRPDGSVIGASGGKGNTVSLEIAAAKRARVKLRPNAQYRPDFIGFRSVAGLVEDP